MNTLELYVRAATWLQREEGQDLIEYALLVVFIAIIVAVVLPGVGQTLVDTYYSQIPGALSGT